MRFSARIVPEKGWVEGVSEDITAQKLAEVSLRESEERYRNLFTSTNDGACVHELIYKNDKPLDYRISDVNPRYESIIGVKRDDAIGVLGSELYGSGEAPYLNIYADVVKTGRSKSFETYFAPMGKYFLISVFSTGAHKFATVFQDITDRKQAQEALRESEERFNLAITGTGAGLWDWDMVNDTVYFSAQWKAMLGYEDHEIENAFSGWKKLWHPDDVTRIEEALKDYLDEKTTKYEIEHRLRHKDGDWRWILTRGDIIKGSDGKPSRWVGTNLDITARKQIEEKLIQSEALLKSSIESPKDMTMLSIDKEYRYLYFNQVHKDSMIAIYDSDIEIGMNLLECIPVEEDRANTKINYDKAFAGESHSIIQEYGESKRFLL